MFNVNKIFHLLIIVAMCHLLAADEVGTKTLYAILQLLSKLDGIIEDLNSPSVDHSCLDKLGDDPTVEQIKKCTDTENVAGKYLSTFRGEKFSENKENILDMIVAVQKYGNKLINIPYYMENEWPLAEMVKKLSDEFEHEVHAF